MKCPLCSGTGQVSNPELRPILCPACHQDALSRLMRQLDGSEFWKCMPKLGGCGANYRLDDPKIVEQQSPRVRAALSPQKPAPEPEPVEEPPDPTQPAAERIWTIVADRLEKTLEPHKYATWFRPARALRLGHQSGEGLGLTSLVVGLPDERFVSWVQNGYGPEVQAVAQGYVDTVQFVALPRSR